MVSCQGCGKETDTRLCCPKCTALGRTSFFCSQECFAKNWPAHNKLHVIIKQSQMVIERERRTSQGGSATDSGHLVVPGGMPGGRTDSSSQSTRSGIDSPPVEPTAVSANNTTHNGSGLTARTGALSPPRSRLSPSGSKDPMGGGGMSRFLETRAALAVMSGNGYRYGARDEGTMGSGPAGGASSSSSRSDSGSGASPRTDGVRTVLGRHLNQLFGGYVKKPPPPDKSPHNHLDASNGRSAAASGAKEGQGSPSSSLAWRLASRATRAVLSPFRGLPPPATAGKNASAGSSSSGNGRSMPPCGLVVIVLLAVFTFLYLGVLKYPRRPGGRWRWKGKPAATGPVPQPVAPQHMVVQGGPLDRPLQIQLQGLKDTVASLEHKILQHEALLRELVQSQKAAEASRAGTGGTDLSGGPAAAPPVTATNQTLTPLSQAAAAAAEAGVVSPSNLTHPHHRVSKGLSALEAQQQEPAAAGHVAGIHLGKGGGGASEESGGGGGVGGEGGDGSGGHHNVGVVHQEPPAKAKAGDGKASAGIKKAGSDRGLVPNF
ncbi:unnamed protein product [Vitrella brassicaformis CCMP3155]|uniref:C6H2-type domain-containing protein n=2 Tax=Vitrella brassicaformis TaxID=1169539 RepID=A0A0G4F5W2_VITBC|nr:unnamed protein product [Vitrella brassicaformis CCMP3155]|mmetsp:Transcript_25186/g.72732  ORF Transcript_25186/g.72732 Transcript_25186/m.72732 type:complete len:546 (+) Transcript_25186:80-1717(+)|eukprot:CEM07383.1 unnamed protein product [Vitrella brassicaformis CCMP3155]